MAKRGYKIQEFMAHSGAVNCLKIGKKECRRFITGGDDHKVNLWTIGKPTYLTSLSGHNSPVQSLAFDSAEVLVLGGASSGVIKLWDLEEAKTVRTVAGQRSSCTAIEFHPFGEFFASGYMDANLKIRDIRKKGCIHTYKGHRQGISSIKFTPDGRWVVSGGFDNAVKVWDLTAGKLLHDFKFHGGHIMSIDFHPLEFLMASASADRTVKFWDLETFELIGSSKREVTGTQSIAFHPDGRTLFTGHQNGLKVYSWEPAICHDTVDMGWTTLGDLCIHDGKVLGCSYFRNSVGVWVADISLIGPYADASDPKKKSEDTEQKLSLHGSKLDKVEDDVGPTSRLNSMSPDESKEIKNIYIDSSGGKPVVALQKFEASNSPKVDLSEESVENSKLGALKQSPATGVHVKSSEQMLRKSLVVPGIVPRETPDGKDLEKYGKETITFSKTRPGMLLKPAHARRASTGRFDVDKFSVDANSGIFCDIARKLNRAKDPKFQVNLGSQNEVRESCEDKYPIKTVTDKLYKTLSLQGISDQTKKISTIKHVNGVAVIRGRTRSLVERFESGEQIQIDEDQTNSHVPTMSEEREKVHDEDQIYASSTGVFERREKNPRNDDQNSMPSERTPRNEDQKNMPSLPDTISETSTVVLERRERIFRKEDRNNTPSVSNRISGTSNMVFQRRERLAREEDLNNIPYIPNAISGLDKSPTILKVEPQTSGGDSKSENEGQIIEALLQTHDVTLSTLRSRLTKLQVERHFWERNDIKGAINALRKLHDQSVQADIISVLVEKMEILTLDLFSCLLPVLTGLLDSKTERHVKVSLDMLLKLVAVFGPTVHETVSACPSLWVDLHQEQRRECCNQCFMELQKIEMTLPIVIRKGGLLAKSALELNLVLQQS
ncbi:PREDICTED: katanin p80 WD40 repeat-containing subunit B1 homolog [Lupinus angustifolius]|uniref:katanin p80 WD40 repeat-containing subunit B1 homolog n=1 Tax=Lupinus angustifolius TaxID=3871 RepID=UPI00092E9768|nr:PREDICTED: katanin p80 WD40 repeat-containing subunit B1 homolog [Lupinus angustifolius]